jgi:hypothetical protein
MTSHDLLRERDFRTCRKVNSWDPEIGPVAAFSWPPRASGQIRGSPSGKLALTKTGRAALKHRQRTPPRDLEWLGHKRDHRQIQPH